MLTHLAALPHHTTPQGPRIWYKTLREIVTLERMHRAFDDGLMEVGVWQGSLVRAGARFQDRCCAVPAAQRSRWGPQSTLRLAALATLSSALPCPHRCSTA